MKRLLCVLAGLLGATLYAQDFSGDWQGTLQAGPKPLRVIFHVTKAEGGVWKATLYSIDQGPGGIPVTAVTVDGPNIKLTVETVHGHYEGRITGEGNSITGTWTQGKPLPLELQRATKETAWQHDASPHTVQFVAVQKDVKLEVLDWGGSGRPVVLLAGLGNTAHVFDPFAPKLTGAYHVYGITRRGFGESSSPPVADGNYAADRLGDDVLAVADSLKLKRPVLAGHSIAGEELSSVGSRRPEKVAGLVYLDAGYAYAYYDRARGNLMLDTVELQKKLEDLLPGRSAQDQKQLIRELLDTTLPQFGRELQDRLKDLETMPAPPTRVESVVTPAQAILKGQQKYTEIRVPALVIFALPHGGIPGNANNPEARAAAEARDLESTGAQAKAFESGVPSAKVVRLAHANHYVFRSNEADVLREMNQFIGGLP